MSGHPKTVTVSVHWGLFLVATFTLSCGFGLGGSCPAPDSGNPTSIFFKTNSELDELGGINREFCLKDSNRVMNLLGYSAEGERNQEDLIYASGQRSLKLRVTIAHDPSLEPGSEETQYLAYYLYSDKDRKLAILRSDKFKDPKLADQDSLQKCLALVESRGVANVSR